MDDTFCTISSSILVIETLLLRDQGGRPFLRIRETWRLGRSYFTFSIIIVGPNNIQTLLYEIHFGNGSWTVNHSRGIYSRLSPPLFLYLERSFHPGHNTMVPWVSTRDTPSIPQIGSPSQVSSEGLLQNTLQATHLHLSPLRHVSRTPSSFGTELPW